MTSLLTNNAAMTALQTLTSTNRSLETTQNRIATGMRVASAQDNAAYWSIATTMRSDVSALSTVQDALGLGSGVADTAYGAVNEAKDLVSEIRNKLVAARQPGVDRGKIQKEITEMQSNLQGMAEAAAFSGENWLSVDSGATGYNATKTVVASFTRSGGNVSIGTISVDISTIALFDADATGEGILDGTRDATGAIVGSGGGSGTFSVSTLDISTLTDSAADITTLESYIVGVDKALGEMTDSAAGLGAVKSRIDIQKSFVASLKDAIETGIGQLVDADMNEESTRLQALQVQAQLGVQALSIANQASQNILSLFR
jgi:flagellin